MTNPVSPLRWLPVALLCVAIANGAEKAPPSSPTEVTVQLFSDFQCPYCAQLAQPIRELESKGVEGVPTKVEFRHFPLDFHQFAQLAHQAAQAAGEQGKFWEMHDLLFSHQNALQRDAILGYAKSLDLDMDRFIKDIDSEKIKQLVERDQAAGRKLGVEGTPTYFINGQQYSGAKTYAELKQLVQGEVRRAQALSEITDAVMSRGPAGAPVTLEFFADLQSPVSRSASYVLDELLAKYPSVIRLQFRNFPLSFHPQAGLAHEAAMAAARQGRFWELAAYAFNHQDSLREQDLLAFAGGIGVDQTKFSEVLREHRYAARVDADIRNGFKRGVRGSPVLFVNSNLHKEVANTCLCNPTSSRCTTSRARTALIFSSWSMCPEERCARSFDRRGSR